MSIFPAEGSHGNEIFLSNLTLFFPQYHLLPLDGANSTPDSPFLSAFGSLYAE